MASATGTKVGHGLARILGIKLHYRNPTGEERISRGESAFSVSTADTFVEEEPTSLEWIRETAPNGQTFINWASRLFPFIHWIGRYNGTWLLADLVAGQSPYLSPLDCSLIKSLQVSPWAPSSFLNRWRMLNWLSFPYNTAFTLHSWVS